MKKTLKFVLTFIFTITILSLSYINIHGEANYCYNLRASVGETPTSIGINYHSSVNTTKVHFGTDPTLTNYDEFIPTCTGWEKAMINDEAQTYFPFRYICTLNIDNLELNTKYYYQVVDENYQSDICSFKTTSNEKTTFGVLCDTQASGSNFQYSDQLVQKLYEINNDINFFMIAGDIVDRGGYEAQWNNLDTYMPVLNHQFLQATIPGNHELYHSSATSYIDESIYNKYYNNPKNGTDQRPNSTYFFKYNNTLFIMLDTMNRSSGNNLVSEQQEWFKNVIINNPAEFIIVVTHPGCYSAGAYSGDASIMRGNWRDLFEEYGVDLAISGHEHLYLRTYPLYQDKINDNGITYVIGGCAGAKKYSGTNSELFEVFLESDNPMGTYTGSIVEIVDDTLTFSYYDMYGNKKDEFTLKSRKSNNSDFEIDTFLDNVSYYYNENTKRNNITWDSNAYGNLQYVEVLITHLNTTVSKYIGPISNEIPVGLGIPNKDYTYEITFTDFDGNKYSKTLNVINDQSKYLPNNFILYINEIEDYKYQIKCTYTANAAEAIYLKMTMDGTTYTFDENNNLLIELTSQPNFDSITLEFFFNYFGSGNMVTPTNEEITINTTLLEHSTTKKGCSSMNNVGILISSIIASIGIVYLIINKKK